jgi:hypothetical protein
MCGIQLYRMHKLNEEGSWVDVQEVKEKAHL